MPAVLIFAGSSFIGRHVCAAFRAAGHAVTATARQAREDFVACDITNSAQVEAVVASVRPDWIVQCAAATSTTDPALLYPVHVLGTLNVLQAARQRGPAARLLIMGSAAEYGAVGPELLPVTEATVCQPTSFFGASKLAQSDLARAAAATFQQSVTIVRPFNVIGPGLPSFYFAASLTSRLQAQCSDPAVRAADFEIMNAHATRDFIDVRDVASAVRGLLEREVVPVGSAGIFNLCTGVETSLLEAATVLGELAGGRRPVPAGTHESRGGIVRSVGDPQKLMHATGWAPAVSWQSSLRDLWAAAQPR